MGVDRWADNRPSPWGVLVFDRHDMVAGMIMMKLVYDAKFGGRPRDSFLLADISHSIPHDEILPDQALSKDEHLSPVVCLVASSGSISSRIMTRFPRA
jgi:hypothetical protein